MLEKAGMDCFFDKKDVKWGDAVVNRIEEELAACTHLVVVISPASLQSQWVPFEIGIAIGRNKKVLPLLTHPSIEPPSFLQSLHYISSLDEAITYFSSAKKNLSTYGDNQYNTSIEKLRNSDQIAVRISTPETTFDDIGGHEQAKDELTNAADILTGTYPFPNKMQRQKLLPCGYILYGPPSTGKTLMAEAFANKLNSSIMSVSATEMIDLDFGKAIERIKYVFSEFKHNEVCVLLIEEFNLISEPNGGYPNDGHTLTAQVLRELDGLSEKQPKFVIGKTNRVNLIHEVFFLPSRLKRIAMVLPDYAARLELAKINAKTFRLDLSIEVLNVLANSTAGFNGDEISSIFRDSVIGKYCDNIEIDAKRLGQLVGIIRKDFENRMPLQLIPRQETQPINEPDS